MEIEFMIYFGVEKSKISNAEIFILLIIYSHKKAR